VNRLQDIVAQTRRSLAERQTKVPEAALIAAAEERLAAGEIRDFASALTGPGVSLIAEHKRRSPSAGAIREDLTLEQVVEAYERGGAAALSVLTEGPSFGGSLDDLCDARASTQLPILRKDFTVEPYQLYEAVAAGADAILLIVAALDQVELEGLHRQATELGLAALVEAHEESELSRALEVGADLVGINSRDLATLEVDTGRTLVLAERIPPEVMKVAESGFSNRTQLSELEQAGFDAVLVGEALMRAPDIEAACRALTGG
jgi:indole-3-glycerol phosphate synthase